MDKHTGYLAFILFASLLGQGAPAMGAQYWEGQLVDGSQIRVDPNTNKAVIQSPRGSSAPLWDGVHKLQDGSTVTVRSGVMVPNPDVLDLRQSEPKAQELASEGMRLCTKLVRKVCGFGNECSTSFQCKTARQLAQFALEEQREQTASGSNRFLETPGQCREALARTDFFAPCKSGEATSCGRLQTKVCGATNQCANQPACKTAQRLVDQELNERLEAESPGGKVPTSGQCETALLNDQLFSACR